MNYTQASIASPPSRPMRADARRNHEGILKAAWQAFAEGGESTALEEIARRAGVGIGTLYRNFPNRQALVEALYVDEVEEVCRSAEQLDGADPWQDLNAWLERFIAYIGTKRALAAELLNYLDQDAALFQGCRASLFAAGEPLLRRAQQAGVVPLQSAFALQPTHEPSRQRCAAAGQFASIVQSTHPSTASHCRAVPH